MKINRLARQRKLGNVFRNHSFTLLATLSIFLAPMCHGSSWTGGGSDDYFDSPENWSAGVPIHGTSNPTAEFNRSAAVEFRNSAHIDYLEVSSPISFLLNGKSFQAYSARIAATAALIAQGGIINLGELTLNGSLLASGASTYISTQDINISWNQPASLQILRFAEGATLQAGNIRITSGASAGSGLYFQSGATGSANWLELYEGKSLTITGPGSGFSANEIKGSGDISLSGGSFLNLGSTDRSYASSLSASGEGTKITAASLQSDSVSITEGAKLNAHSLSLRSLYEIRPSLAIMGAGSSVDISILETDLGYNGNRPDVSISDGGTLAVGYADVNRVSVIGNGSKLTADYRIGATSVLVSEGAELNTQNLSSGSLTVSSGGFVNLKGNNSGFGNHTDLDLMIVEGAGSKLFAGPDYSISATSVSITDGAQLKAQALEHVLSLTVSGENSSVVVQQFSASDGNIRVADHALLSFTSGTGVLETLSINNGNLVSKSGMTVNGILSVTDGNFAVDSLVLSGSGAILGSTTRMRNLTNNGSLEIRDTVISGSDDVQEGTLGNGVSGVLSGSFTTNHNLDNGGIVKIGADDEMAFKHGSNSGYIQSENSIGFTGYFDNTADGLVTLSGNFRANDGIRNSGDFEITGDANLWGGDFYNSQNASVAVFGQSTANFMDDVINDGTIAVAEGSTVVFHGEYSGGGVVTGTGNTLMLGDLRPGHSPGSQTFEGDVTFGELFTYHVEIGGLNRGIDYDAIDVGGLLTLGGTLSISLIDGVTLNRGDTFEILTFGFRSGDFAIYEGFDLGNNSAFQAVWGEDHLTLVVIPEPATMVLWGIGAMFLWHATRGRRLRC